MINFCMVQMSAMGLQKREEYGELSSTVSDTGAAHQLTSVLFFLWDIVSFHVLSP